MLGNLFKQIADKDFIDKILQQVEGDDFVQCGKCASIKIGAKEVIQVLAKIDSDSNFWDYTYTLLPKIIEGVPSEYFNDMELWEKWDKENKYRKLNFLTSYETDQYLKFKDVLLVTDSQCQCFCKERNAASTKSTSKT